MNYNQHPNVPLIRWLIMFVHLSTKKGIVHTHVFRKKAAS